VQATAEYIPQLRRSLLFHDTRHDHEETIECRYVRGGKRYENGKTKEMEGCESKDGIIYELPPGLLQGYKVHELQSGKTMVHIVGATPVHTRDTQQSDHIEVGTTSTVTIFPAPMEGGTGNTWIKTVGRSNVIAVRVTSRDAEVSLSADEISESLFGEGVTFASQMNLCSNGALTFEPATGNGITGAVGEIYIDVNSVGVATGNLHSIVRDEFIKKFGQESQYDHIMYCLPFGTGEVNDSWIAYAYKDTSYSYYHDAWCGSLTSKMHEVGHNLGFGHSGEGDTYEDRSCIMGVSYLQRDGPQECYNGLKNWAADWFVDHQVVVDPVANGPWGGNLAAFVDYTDIANGEYAIINVRDLYVQYNMAKKYNQEVEEKANQVTVVQSGGSFGEVSAMLVGLDMGSPSFTYSHQGVNIIIQVCEPGSHGNVDYMRMSIHTIDQTSTCDLALPTPPPPTPQLTPQPTSLPTLQPTVTPTLLPTVTPTSQPTVSLTSQPTVPPTSQPTVTPTLQLTPQLPTLQPALPPTPQPFPQTSTSTSTSTQGTVLRRPPIPTWDFADN
jgi:hypothetical protein